MIRTAFRVKRWLACIAIVFACTGHAIAQVDTELLLRAAEVNNIERIEAALKRGADPNTSDEHGNTLLAVAAAEGYLDLAKLLIANRARVNNRNAYGDTPLMVAAYHGKPDMVQLLIASGAEVNTEGWTPLHYAAVRGDNALIQYLVSKGADVKASSVLGQSPVDLARGGRAGYFERVAYPETVTLLQSLGSPFRCLSTLFRGTGDFCEGAGIEPWTDLSKESTNAR